MGLRLRCGSLAAGFLYGFSVWVFGLVVWSSLVPVAASLQQGCVSSDRKAGVGVPGYGVGSSSTARFFGTRGGLVLFRRLRLTCRCVLVFGCWATVDPWHRFVV